LGAHAGLIFVPTIKKLEFRSKECVFLEYSNMHKGFKCLDVSIGRIYIFRDVIIDESIFPFAKLHPNAGVRLRSKILLLPPSLIPPESLHNDVNNLGEPVTNFPHPVNTNGGSSTRVQVADFSSTDTHDNTERPLAPVQTTAAAPPVAAINEDTVSISCAPARLSSGAEQGGASPARGSGHHSLGSDLGTVSPPRALVQQGPDADPVNSRADCIGPPRSSVPTASALSVAGTGRGHMSYASSSS
jgi:hypothetical protein